MTDFQKPCRPRSRRPKKGAAIPEMSDGIMSRPKEALLGLCFLALGLVGLAIAVDWAQALVGPLRAGEPIVEAHSPVVGFPLIVLALLGLGILVLLSAARSPWAFRHAGTVFGGILAALVVGVALMVGGDLFNATLLRHHGYVACDSKASYRMTTTLWALQERGCDGVDFTTSRPL